MQGGNIEQNSSIPESWEPVFSSSLRSPLDGAKTHILGGELFIKKDNNIFTRDFNVNNTHNQALSFDEEQPEGGTIDLLFTN